MTFESLDRRTALQYLVVAAGFVTAELALSSCTEPPPREPDTSNTSAPPVTERDEAFARAFREYDEEIAEHFGKTGLSYMQSRITDPAYPNHIAEAAAAFTVSGQTAGAAASGHLQRDRKKA